MINTLLRVNTASRAEVASKQELVDEACTEISILAMAQQMEHASQICFSQLVAKWTAALMGQADLRQLTFKAQPPEGHNLCRSPGEGAGAGTSEGE